MNPTTLINPEQLRELAVTELNLGGLTSEQQDNVIDAVGEMLFEGVILRLLEELPENQRARFTELMQNAEDEQLQALLHEHIPNLEAVIQDELQSGIRGYKEQVAAYPQTTLPAEKVAAVPASPYTFTHAVPTVWTAVENVLQEAGITHKGLLNFVTDLVEDYTQDGSIPETRQTSYHRDYGAGLLAHMTGQQNVTQATIKNSINTAPLFASEPIFKSMKDRIDNSFLTAQQQAEVKELLKKIHDVAKNQSDAEASQAPQSENLSNSVPVM